MDDWYAHVVCPPGAHPGTVGSLPAATWRRSLFQLADIWTNGIKPAEYAHFLVSGQLYHSLVCELRTDYMGAIGSSSSIHTQRVFLKAWVLWHPVCDDDCNCGFIVHVGPH